MTEEERLELEEQYNADIDKVISLDDEIKPILPIFDTFYFGEENPYRTEYDEIIKRFFDEMATGTTYNRYLSNGFKSLTNIEFINGLTVDDISAAISELERKLKSFYDKLEKERVLEKYNSKKYKNRIELYNKSIRIALSLTEKKMNELNIQIKKIEASINKLTDKKLINNKLKPQLDQLKKMFEKTKNDYEFIKTLSDYMDNEALKFIDPIEKSEKEEILNQKISDLELTRTDRGSELLVEKLNKELEITKQNYERMIQKTKNQNTQQLLKEELERKESDLHSRINNVENLKELSDSDRQTEIDDAFSKKSELDIIYYDEDCKSMKENFKEMQSTVGPLFEEKEIKTFGEDNSIRVTNGKSIFDYILESSDSYNMYKNRIEQLESKMKELTVKEEIAEDTLGFFAKKSIKREKKNLEFQLKIFKEQKVVIEANQKILMITRDKAIKKRNDAISRSEERAERHRKQGHKLRAKINEVNANWLSDIPSTNFKEMSQEHKDLGNKKRAIAYSILSKVASRPIRLSSASTILMKEELKIQLKTKKATINGKINKRLWQELALDEIERKTPGNKNQKKNYSVTEEEKIWLQEAGEIEKDLDWSELERIAEEEAKAGKTR